MIEQPRPSVEVVRIAKKIQFQEDNERLEQLESKIEQLFQNGFNEILFQSMVPKFFVEKGFSLQEALIISKQKDCYHPQRHEIMSLSYDEETMLLKLEQRPQEFRQAQIVQQDHKTYYILVIGPTNRGKTTVIFNLINSLYNINIDSLYRVKKGQGQTTMYYDEYQVEITDKISYVFADFKGIGDVKLDFLGSDLSGRHNLYTAILEYISLRQNILSILFVNSASINRLGQDEKYQLQRFFEIIPEDFVDKIFLILTYCTDNQPILTVYKNCLSVPESLRNRIPEIAGILPQNKFWFGINNVYLYQTIDYQKSLEYLENNQVDIKQIIDNYQPNTNLSLNIKILPELGEELLAKLTQQEENRQVQGEDIQISPEELQKIYYDQMVIITKEVLQKISQINSANHFNTNFVQNTLDFEKEILTLLKIKNTQSNHQFPNRIITAEVGSNYIEYKLQKSSTEGAEKPVRKQTKCLFCITCNDTCHEACYLESFNEIQSKTKFCRKLIDGRGAISKNEDFEQYKKQIICKICKEKRQRQCTLVDHQLYTSIKIVKCADIGKVDKKLHEEFQIYWQNKKVKKGFRLQQQAIFKGKCNYQEQVQNVISLLTQLNNQRSTAINLVERTKLINAISNQLAQNQQEQDNDYLLRLAQVKEIYNKIAPVPLDAQLQRTGIIQPISVDNTQEIDFDPPEEPQSQIPLNQNTNLRQQQELAQAIPNFQVEQSPLIRNLQENLSFIQQEESPLINQHPH